MGRMLKNGIRPQPPNKLSRLFLIERCISFKCEVKCRPTFAPFFVTLKMKWLMRGLLNLPPELFMWSLTSNRCYLCSDKHFTFLRSTRFRTLLNETHLNRKHFKNFLFLCMLQLPRVSDYLTNGGLNTFIDKLIWIKCNLFLYILAIIAKCFRKHFNQYSSAKRQHCVFITGKAVTIVIWFKNN